MNPIILPQEMDELYSNQKESSKSKPVKLCLKIGLVLHSACVEGLVNAYSHLPPITQTIQVRQIKYARHCWRSNDELMNNVFKWSSTYDHKSVG